jgi:uncharacterized protein (UPF0332 family)
MTGRHSSKTYIRKAEAALTTARRNLEAHDSDGACDRAYYAMFNAAHAALFALGVEGLASPIKTHNGLVAKFGQEVVVPGHLPAGYGSDLNKVQRYREVADYSADSVETNNAVWSVERAAAFIDAVKKKFRV